MQVVEKVGEIGLKHRICVIESLFKCYTRKWKEHQTWLCQNATPNMEFFLFFLVPNNKYKLWKEWKLACCDQMIPVGHGKNLRMFRQSYDVHCFQIEPSPRRNTVSRENGSTLRAKRPMLHLLALKVFLHSRYTITWAMSKFGIFQNLFAIFKLSSAFLDI